jgi:hypothetical protein
MPQPMYPQQGGHGLKRAEDHGHYPEEDLVKDVGSRAYQLKKHEKKNLEAIERKIHSGDVDSHELHEFLHYLEEFSHEIREILQEEKSEGISNIELERDLRKVAQLIGEISSVLERQAH